MTYNCLFCSLKAVKIDNSEVTVWYKVGVTALVLEDFQLAMLAFEQGLNCNPKHWPCLDNVISILYALNNYLGKFVFNIMIIDIEKSPYIVLVS
jgi:calcineurin-binding protein cabin-1